MLSVCKEKASEEDVLKYLEIALRSAAQLERIVNELVLYAEDGVDIVSVQEELFNCVEEFGKIAGVYAKQAQDAGLEFQYSVQAGSDQNICTDQHRLFQIVGNIIENAVKYTKNGNVWLGVTLNAEPGDEKGWLDVTVKDTGIGMDEADMDRIFEPFFQADRSFSRSYNGLVSAFQSRKPWQSAWAVRSRAKAKRERAPNFDCGFRLFWINLSRSSD